MQKNYIAAHAAAEESQYIGNCCCKILNTFFCTHTDTAAPIRLEDPAAVDAAANATAATIVVAAAVIVPQCKSTQTCTELFI